MFRRRDPEAEERLRRALERIREECDPWSMWSEKFGACVGKILAEEDVDISWVLREPLGEKLKRWLNAAFYAFTLLWCAASMVVLGPFALYAQLRESGHALAGAAVCAVLGLLGALAFMYMVRGGSDP